MPSSSGFEITGTDNDGLRVSAIGEPTTEASVNSDVDEAPTRSDNSPCLPEDGEIFVHIGVNHYGYRTRERSIPKGRAITIGPRNWKPGSSVSKHPGRDVNAEG